MYSRLRIPGIFAGETRHFANIWHHVGSEDIYAEPRAVVASKVKKGRLKKVGYKRL